MKCLMMLCSGGVTRACHQRPNGGGLCSVWWRCVLAALPASAIKGRTVAGHEMFDGAVFWRRCQRLPSKVRRWRVMQCLMALCSGCAASACHQRPDGGGLCSV